MRGRRTITRGELGHLLRTEKGLMGETQIILKDLDLSGMNLRELSFNNATIDNVDFSCIHGYRADFTNASISNSVFDGVDMSGSSWSGATIQNTTFKGATAWGADFTHTTIKNVRMEKASLVYSNFEGSRMVDVTFRGATLGKAKWKGSSLYRLTFTGACLIGAKFESPLRGLVFRKVGPVGTYCGDVTYLPEHDIVIAGCWQGNVKEFYNKCKQVEESHPRSNLSLDIAQDMVRATKKDYKEGTLQ